MNEERARRYATLKRRLWCLDLFVTTGFLAVLLASQLAQRLGHWIQAHLGGWPFQVAAYATLLGASLMVFTFPLDIVRSFLLERRFSLSPLTFPRWLIEYGKHLLAGGLLGLAGIEALAGILRAFPSGWWMGMTLFWIGWSILLTRIFPTLLLPLFYRQRPLKDPVLENRLRDFLSRVNAKVAGIFEVNLSKTTHKANACLCGLGKSRRVLLADTLVGRYPPEEVEVVLAHEVGHHRFHHIAILLLVSTVAFGAGCFLVDRAARQVLPLLLVKGFGDLAALPVIGLGLIVVNLAFLPVVNGISRRLEAQADRFALESTKNPVAFIGAMRHLAEQNLAELTPPQWVVWLLYDHPPISQRIALAEAPGGGRG